jgi:hypothetical protein
MRPLYALAAAATILGVVAAYMKFQASVTRPPATVVERVAEGSFSVELTLTFDAAPDAFSLEGDSVLVTFRNRKLLARQDHVAAGTPIVIEDVQGIVAGDGRTGRNEFYVKATPAEDSGETEFAVSRAVRVRVLRDGQPVGDSTIWSAPGQPVEGVVTVAVAPSATASEEEHAHDNE